MRKFLHDDVHEETVKDQQSHASASKYVSYNGFT